MISKIIVSHLTHSDQTRLDAAVGWLGLGNWSEANEELDRITPVLRAHPHVLKVRYCFYVKAEKWELALEIAQTLALELPHDSFGFVQSAYALDRLGRTREAFALLQTVVGNFPQEVGIRYDLACYACKSGSLKEAMGYLERAIDFAGRNDIRLKALNDPALGSLWTDIGEI